MKKIIVLFTILFVACHAFAQEKISGYVEDSLTHNRLANVSVTLLRNGKPLKFTRSKEDGTFLIPIAQKQASDMLQATYMGYKNIFSHHNNCIFKLWISFMILIHFFSPSYLLLQEKTTAKFIVLAVVL